MTTPRKSVAVTGSSGYVGSTLLRHLEEYGAFDKLVAIDNRPLPFPVHNVYVYRRDITESFQDALVHNNVSTLVHLAHIGRRGRNLREVNEIRNSNLDALQNVLECCVRARVQHIIHLSSYAVYGARPDNPIPLTVRSPLRVTPDSPLGYDKLLAEQKIQDFSDHLGNTKVTILRAATVLGPTAPAQAIQEFSRQWLVGPTGYDAPVQFLHEEDLARVLHLLIARELPGVFNVAADGVVFHREMADMIGSKFARLPFILAYPLVQLASNTRLQKGYAVDELNLIRYPLVLNTGTLRQATGYQFWHTSMETLASFANPNIL